MEIITYFLTASLGEDEDSPKSVLFKGKERVTG